jgi:teichuronic acid biosynthesis glycosyltransferase TuaC
MMKDAAAESVVVFSEEYTRVTKGLFAVWMTHADAASKHRQVDVVLNRGHWALDEAKAAFVSNPAVTVHSLPFTMPGALLARAFSAADRSWLLRSTRFALGELLNLLVFPVVVLYFWQYLRKTRPRAVFSHAGGWPAGPLCRWLIYGAALAHVPSRNLIIHNFPKAVGGSIWGLMASPMRLLRSWSIEKWATNIVTVSDSVKESLEATIFRRSVVRVHNGIPLSPFEVGNPPSPDRPVWRASCLTVGFVGALFPLKGPHVLLEAFRLVETPSELALLGPADSVYLESLRQRARLCKNPVSFLGFHNNADWFMEQIDLLVVPSVAFESFGMVILEAMKHRKSVICTDFGGMKEVVEDGVSGLVVPAGDIVALANAITALLTDADARRQMGEAGYRRLHELFTAEKMLERYDLLVARDHAGVES